MVGLSHAVLRAVIQEYMPTQDNKISPTIWPTEMLNSRRLPQEILGCNSETYVHEGETHLVPQLLGNQNQEIKDSIIKLNTHWDLSGIDINMGCPVQKALKHNYGVSLMGDFDYAAQVVQYAVEAADECERDIPISVKLRAVGSDKSADELCRFIEKLAEKGASWITLHPRTADQKRRGQADWDQIKFLKARSPIPIIGNGDIQITSDIFSMLEETGADKVMSGRALTARPWLMWQVGEKLNMAPPSGKDLLKAPQTEVEEGAEYGRMLLRFIDLCEEYFIKKVGLKENLVLRKIQFFIRTNHVWLQFGHRLMALSNRSQTLNELRDHVNDFFKSEQIMYKQTELRQ